MKAKLLTVITFILILLFYSTSYFVFGESQRLKLGPITLLEKVSEKEMEERKEEKSKIQKSKLGEIKEFSNSDKEKGEIIENNKKENNEVEEKTTSSKALEEMSIEDMKEISSSTSEKKENLDEKAEEIEDNKEDKEKMDITKQIISKSEEIIINEPQPNEEDKIKQAEEEKDRPIEKENNYIYQEQEYNFIPLSKFKGYITRTTIATNKVKKENANNNVSLEKGDVVEIYGVSENEDYYIAKIGNDEKMFIRTNNVSKKEVYKESQPQVTPQPQENIQTEIQQPQVQQQISQQPIQQNLPAPYLTDGISFPKDPISLSKNNNITFADESFVAYTTAQARISSGPGAIATSTGYHQIATVLQGTGLNCTGIGQNGYIRVKLPNGTIGFVDGRYLKK